MQIIQDRTGQVGSRFFGAWKEDFVDPADSARVCFFQLLIMQVLDAADLLKCRKWRNNWCVQGSDFTTGTMESAQIISMTLFFPLHLYVSDILAKTVKAETESVVLSTHFKEQMRDMHPSATGFKKKKLNKIIMTCHKCQLNKNPPSK